MIFDGLLKPISEVISKGLDLIPDPNKRAEIEKEITLAGMDLDKAQMAVNQEEAKSSSFFVAGWRPSVGWICSIGLLWAYILQPISIFFLKVFGYSGVIPEINTDGLLQLLFGLLGMGALRSFEKVKGVTK